VRSQGLRVCHFLHASYLSVDCSVGNHHYVDKNSHKFRFRTQLLKVVRLKSFERVYAGVHVPLNDGLSATFYMPAIYQQIVVWTTNIILSVVLSLPDF